MSWVGGPLRGELSQRIPVPAALVPEEQEPQGQQVPGGQGSLARSLETGGEDATLWGVAGGGGAGVADWPPAPGAELGPEGGVADAAHALPFPGPGGERSLG